MNDSSESKGTESNIEVLATIPEDVPVKEKKDKTPEECLEDPRARDFLKFYYDKTEKETFANKTKSYIKAFNLDPKEQYNSARTLAPKLFAKIGMSGREYLENSGWGLPKLLDLNVAKAISTDNAKYLEMLYEMGEYKQPAGVNITNNQLNLFKLDDPKVEDFNKQFQDFLEGQ